MERVVSPAKSSKEPMNPVQDDSFNTFERCPHDRVNPYAQINRDLIRNKDLSPQCRWFLIYCLSFDNSWKISIPYFMKEQGISKNRMYPLIDEAVEAGYIKRETFLVKGLKRYKYFVSEFPKFKKCLPCPQNQGTENQYTENEDSTNKQSSSYEEEKKEQLKEKARAASPPSADAESCVEFFLKSLKERKPDMETPNKKKWAEEFDVLIKKKKRSPEDLKAVITWAAKTHWYKSNVLSPSSLGKQFDKMWLNMEEERERGQEKEIVTKNKDFCLELKERYPKHMERLVIRGGYAINPDNAKEVPFTLPEDTFQKTLVQIFGGEV